MWDPKFNMLKLKIKGFLQNQQLEYFYKWHESSIGLIHRFKLAEIKTPVLSL